MSYAITAVLPSGIQTFRESSAAATRADLSSARAQGAQSVSLSENGKAITEADIGKLTATLVDKLA